MFKQSRSLDERKVESKRVRERYPDRMPIICERNPLCKQVPEIDKKKYLIPRDLTLAQFMYVIRKRIRLTSDKALFAFVNHTTQPSSALLSDIYENHKDEDGFLYITYSGEQTFG
jgi:GABA(A) receptor-associated protein